MEEESLCIFFWQPLVAGEKKQPSFLLCGKRAVFFLLSVSYQPSGTWVGHGLLLLSALQLPCKSKLLQGSEAEQPQCKG